jgi:archaellum biogenesis protein FlaJ (TadC family)
MLALLAAATTPPSIAERVAQIDLFFVLVAFLGALALYVVAKNNNQDPFSLAKAINVTTTHPLHAMIDMVLTSLFGALLACLLITPTTIPHALTAGLGWVGILGAIKK